MTNTFAKKIILLLTFAFLTPGLNAQSDGSNAAAQAQVLTQELRELETLSTMLRHAESLHKDGAVEKYAGQSAVVGAYVYGGIRISQGAWNLIEKFIIKSGLVLNWKNAAKYAVVTAGSAGIGYLLREKGEYTVALSELLITAIENKLQQRREEIESEMDALLIVDEQPNH